MLDALAMFPTIFVRAFISLTRMSKTNTNIHEIEEVKTPHARGTGY